MSVFGIAGAGRGGRQSQAGPLWGLSLWLHTLLARALAGPPAAWCRACTGDSAVTQPWTPHKRDTVPRSSLTARLLCAPKYLCLSVEAAAPGFLWKNAAGPAPPALRYLLGTGRAQLGLR